jgi:hypothetical protein
MIVEEKEMRISQTCRADSAPQDPKSALRGMMQRLGLTLLACTLAIGATGSASAQQANGTTQAAPPISGIIGKVQSFTGRSLDLQTPSGVVHVDVKQPLTTYKQIPSDLSHVTPASYVGVASTEQADGKEVAKQIIIFPAELSGAAEGSVLTDPPGATTHSRMTNGSVSADAEGFLTVTAKGIAEDFAQDLPDNEKQLLTATQGSTAAAVFGATVTTAAWKIKPSWCVIASNDRAFSPELEKAEAAAIKATSITVPSSHVPMLSHPKEVADLIEQAAAKAGSR